MTDYIILDKNNQIVLNDMYANFDDLMIDLIAKFPGQKLTITEVLRYDAVIPSAYTDYDKHPCNVRLGILKRCPICELIGPLSADEHLAESHNKIGIKVD